eukprot:134403-Pyramimonas_sp.AAC.1
MDRSTARNMDINRDLAKQMFEAAYFRLMHPRVRFKAGPPGRPPTTMRLFRLSRGTLVDYFAVNIFAAVRSSASSRMPSDLSQ